MLNLHDPLVQVRVTSVTCSSVAILSTICRIVIRRRKLWIDDAAAIFSLLALVAQIVAVFITPSTPSFTHTSHSRLNLASIELGTNIGEIRYYIIAVTFFAVLWSARLSILFSLVRINPFPEQQTKLKFVAVVFIVIPLLLVLQCFLTCAPKPAWKSWAIPQCVLDNSSAICQLIADVLSDGVLLYVPTRLLMILSDKNLRIRLILIFSTCIITSLVGLAHAIEIFRTSDASRVYTAIIENNIALIVCNTPVILTSMIDLKEAPWEERHLLHDLRNIELVTLPSPISEGTDDNNHNINNQPALRRNSRIIDSNIHAMPLPDRALLLPHLHRATT
ncbi:hypothetical protein P691DRAFT_799740 [Macrolepiota fuliginosa MF-IS2]|uniref:Rhodopsin domain-containing protein n=1 Tax=Macrolepiota fuliginosa MF-IS2 TaxID=1400762 RepID=A0A9P5XGW3_9AGAR|nr:hypothetical protein P691DRAFT_799740 [Macrolepiota fuliginosa MF-IS2]